MTALELISFINQVLFVGLFVAVLRHALRERTMASANVALLFGSIAAVLAVSRLADLTGFEEHPAYAGIVISLLALAPLAMVRLVDDFSHSPRPIQVAGVIGYLAVAALALLVFGPMQRIVGIVAIAFFLVVGGYAAYAFAREARRTRSITARRMTAVAIGAGAFIGALVLVFAGVVLPRFAEQVGILAQIAALVAAVGFFLGFAPPAWIRHAWREPHLRRFLERSIHLAGVTDERRAVAQLNAAAADAFGANGASIGLADPERGVLRYVSEDGSWSEFPEDAFIAGRAFREGRRVVSRDAASDDPVNAEEYRRWGAHTVIAAPISTEGRRLGVLSVFAERTSFFVDDDVWLVDLLADQSAVLLEARALAREASELQAREEAARLQEDFLSAAAHDLRTPLTVVLGQAELLERRRQRDPSAPVDPQGQGLARIAREARRLRDLVTQLLDARRLEQGGAVMDMAPADLLVLVESVRERYAEGGVGVSVDEPALSLVASIDSARIEQVLDNLVENALKYTPGGDAPEIHVAAVDDEARIAVVDHGVGIPESDRRLIFERFYRASNAQSITDTGLGLGLYICRRIVEQHGGRIWFEPTPGGGTTFVIGLPLLSPPPPAASGERPGDPWEARAPREAAADA